MANYVILLNWTQQGIAGAKDTLNRATKLADLLKNMGGKMKNALWTVGPYDVVLVLEAPDDEPVTAFLLALGAQGNARTTTLRAFDRNEMKAILGKVAE